MTSEHSFWRPWLDDQARAGRQVRAALGGLKLIAPVSGFLAEDIERYARERNMALPRTQVLPNVVDEVVFKPGMAQREDDQLLYVGLIRGFKRVDVLLQAFALARRQRPALRLKILSAKSYAYASDRRQMMELIDSLSLREAVDIIVGAAPTEVAEAMRRTSFVVVSSARRETFCSVAAEALACGTPLITTRCGGPEDFVGADDGVMVEPDDPQALCDGILAAFYRRGGFDSAAISRRITERFGREAWARQAQRTYESIVASAPARGAAG
jgi:glycosyltransferase involved in cell wall biosynthesis